MTRLRHDLDEDMEIVVQPLPDEITEAARLYLKRHDAEDLQEVLAL